MPSVRQHDPGDALWLTDPNREPQRREGPLETHAGARRIAGGTARLVDTQAAALPAACVRTSSALLMLRDRRAVLALLQRLGAEHVRFDPLLPAMLADALAATPILLSAELAFNNTSCALSELP
ncbi:hypothetical protein [Paraburkholderia sp. BL6669N2]|uniref:hypothetical protein n=1 Tax=Paraburkholderia sp. BL6669N2 TaxID=1938807 RepID=UPI000E26D7B9|nr:hypothetical protein [Paraburkholderia sp. BL6669N2]